MSMANSGYLYPNDKGGVAARPDLRGVLNFNEEPWYASGWIQEDDTISLSFIKKGVKIADSNKSDAGNLVSLDKKSPKFPDMGGSVEIEGKTFEIKAWKKMKEGVEMYTFTLQDPNDQSWKNKNGGNGDSGPSQPSQSKSDPTDVIFGDIFSQLPE